jgi:signal transduction histidine kinase/FtsH-binding integral membrane protein
VSGLEQLQYLSWLLYLVVFVLVLARAVHRPTPAHIDMTLFFGVVAIVIVSTTLTSKMHLAADWVGDVLVPAAVAALGYLLLRLVHDFSSVPTLLMRAVEIGMVACIAAVVLGPRPVPDALALGLVVYLVLVIAYDTWAFARHARRTQGVTRRRMQAAAAGSLCLDLDLVVAGVGVVLPSLPPGWEELGAALGLASGVCYFVGFAPPTWLRRAWQEPEVRAFLTRVTSLTRLPDMRDLVGELERGAADALGAPAARVALWDPDRCRLRLFSGDRFIVLPRLPRAWLEQRATLSVGPAGQDPPDSALADLYSARAIMAAPITAYGKRLGVLIVYAPKPPVFANSDLELIQLLADQAAVALENRELIDEAAQVRAREEATRLKEDFLSSAAHDLKTPLTGIVTQAQLLRRRAERDPSAPPDRVGLDRLLEQSHRLKNLVLELLDVSRLEHGSLVGERQEADLAGLVRSLARQEQARWKRVRVQADEPVRAAVDVPRFEQVITNLVENALKYSPHQAPVTVTVWAEDGTARLSVRDEGIGIPAEDQPLVFERFHRARNVDDRRFAGMGLGLYIARGIVQQHGGKIWLESAPGMGSTFQVALPGGSPNGVGDGPALEEATA